MARIRSIKPSFWTDEKLTTLPREVRLTFIGLFSHADDDGRLKGDPRLIKAAIYPLDDDMTASVIEKHLSQLAKAGRVLRYKSDGAAYLSIPTFRDHQRISHPQKSDLPAPQESPAEDARNDCGTTAEDARNDCGASVSGMEVEWNGVEGEARAEPASAADAAPVGNWWGDGGAWWRANAGRITDSAFRKAIAPSVEAHGWEAVHRGMQFFVKRQRAQNRGLNLAWFAKEDSRWIDEEADGRTLIGVGGNEAEILAYCAANPVRAAR